ncbi:unnamed protein product, partial [Clonostachys rhizophaga]
KATMSTLERKAVPTNLATAGSITSEYHSELGHLNRRLGNRQIQLIAAGGSIGTALFINIGSALAKGGPGSLLLAFTLYTMILALVNNSAAEMNTYMPVAGGFIRHAGYWVDDALGFVAGWNFFLFEAFLIPFEISALTFVMSFWTEAATQPGPTAGIYAAVILIYGVLNCLAVKFYGEVEFWLSSGKIILILILFSFTFITMVGGNPQNDAYGFRYFSNPGSFSQYLSSGDLGRFEGFLSCLWTSALTIVGPEYISMVAAEAKHPSVYLKTAFITVYYRFGAFFILGALAVGIVVPYNDEILQAVWLGAGSGKGTAAASPYVIAMENLGISVLPHIVNALILTSIFSAGNTYVYCASRALYSLSLDGCAPRILSYCTSKGVPIYCFAIVMLFSFLSFLQAHSGSAVVLTWLASIITEPAKFKGLTEEKSHTMDISNYIALVFLTLVLFGYGYYAFRPSWNVETFFQSYSMQILSVILFVGWKIINKTDYVTPDKVDLIWERPGIDRYEDATTEPPLGFWEEMIRIVGFPKEKGMSDAWIYNHDVGIFWAFNVSIEMGS